MYKFVILRHGESKWNLENKFTGWTDVELTPTGINEAKNAGKLLKSNGFSFDFDLRKKLFPYFPLLFKILLIIYRVTMNQ